VLGNCTHEDTNLQSTTRTRTSTRCYMVTQFVGICAVIARLHLQVQLERMPTVLPPTGKHWNSSQRNTVKDFEHK